MFVYRCLPPFCSVFFYIFYFFFIYKKNLYKSGESSSTAVCHHVSVQATQSIQGGLIAQLLKIKRIEWYTVELISKCVTSLIPPKNIFTTWSVSRNCELFRDFVSFFINLFHIVLNYFFVIYYHSWQMKASSYLYITLLTKESRSTSTKEMGFVESLQPV